MLLLIDVLARLVFERLEPRLFGGADGSILEITRFDLVDTVLLTFKLSSFPGRQLTRLQAPLDALLLINVALLVAFDHIGAPRARAKRVRHHDHGPDSERFHGDLL